MELFGEDFARYKEDEPEEVEPAAATAAPAKSLESTDPSKAKKGKLNAKSTGLTYQFQILELIGVPATNSRSLLILTIGSIISLLSPSRI